MKFLLLMNVTRRDWEAIGTWPPQAVEAHLRFMHRIVEELRTTGELLLAEGLDVPANAKIVKAAREDAPLVSDGPFAETKEFLAGFWLVEVASAQRAHAIAARASTAPGPNGAPMAIPIEVRQVMSAPSIEP